VPREKEGDVDAHSSLDFCEYLEEEDTFVFHLQIEEELYSAPRSRGCS
jgi:hypothetical protein